MNDPRAFWNERFGTPTYIYGEAPNDFLREVAGRLRGPVLSLGEGEGRNAVFLAEQGLDVTAVDISDQGLRKTALLAAKRGVKVKTVLADLADYDFEPGTWGAIVSIWCHLPAQVRAPVHRAAVRALAPGGAFVLEAYTPRQLNHGTGGPKTADLLYEPEELQQELDGLQLEIFEEREREVNESALHRGTSAVVRVFGTAVSPSPRR